ncbi:MAG TPA: (2Fe-2S) ferredoxin domain-containing protein [Phycisphaerae bacterium]|nr:(2Fe-2S) ferredoxin domain-containing protein [Phycisphaerae bacterium]
MAAYERHVFVCTNERESGHIRGCCAAKDSGKIRERLKELVKQRGLARKVRVNASGCLDQCEHGVTMVVYPEAVWYGFVKMTDVEEIFESHIVGGNPVARLQLPPACINTDRCPHKGGGTVTLGIGR